MRAERDAARAHTDKAIDAEAKWRAEARTLRTCLDAELAVQDQQDEGLIDTIESLEKEILRLRAVLEDIANMDPHAAETQAPVDARKALET